MNTTNRTLLGIILAAIVTLIVIWTMPLYKIEPKGIVLPVDGPKTPFKGSVGQYGLLTAPFSSTTIGTISVEFHTLDFSTKNQEVLINSAKKLAAAAGGSGLVIEQILHTGNGTPAPMQNKEK